MSKSDHKHKLKCLCCGVECDPVDRVKVFGRPSFVRYHQCIKCREKEKAERRKMQEIEFNNIMEVRKIAGNKRKIVANKTFKSLANAQNAYEQMQIAKADADFIGL